MGVLQIDLDHLQAFERGLDPQHVERSAIPARVLGYGEISTVFEVQVDGLRHLACKRLPIFQTPAEMETYTAAYEEYNRLLNGEIGITIP
ncbi:MAG: hypothetical protein KJ734_11360, partial [Chloroflexi bacterium]|nr:hypothetical protein [Chloroflexota bacterium]